MSQKKIRGVYCSIAFLSRFKGPVQSMRSFFVWKRPCPNLEEVSIHLRETSSLATELVGGMRGTRRVIGRLTKPGHEPLIMMKSCLTSPYRTNPPIGVICLSVRSISVLALYSPCPHSSSDLPIM